MRGVAQIRGDFGNPKGTGFARITVDNLESADAETGVIDMDTFVDSLISGGFTSCNIGDVAVTITTPQQAAKPGADVNVDSQLVVVFKKADETRTRKLTIPGIAYDSPLLTAKDAGKRLNDDGATELEGYLNTLFGWTDLAKVISGKWIGTP